MRSWLAGCTLVLLGLLGLASVEAGASDRARLAPDTGFGNWDTGEPVDTGEGGDTAEGEDSGAIDDTGAPADTADGDDSGDEDPAEEDPADGSTDDGEDAEDAGPSGPRYSAAQEAGEEGGFGCSALPPAGSLAAIWAGLLLLARRRDPATPQR